LSTGQAEALKRLRDARKDLARVKTHLRAQELNGPQARKTALKKARRSPRKTSGNTCETSNGKIIGGAKAAKESAERTSKTKKAGKA